MIGERENFDNEINYGALVMRSYNIDGNEINAFYDSSNVLVFVLDNTINSQKPNVLLVINPEADKKWDEILSGDYGVDLETIRPKIDNKYQKLDIEYSGLSVYDDLINAYNSGDSLEDVLKQLSILRDSAVRHSAMMRLNAANEIIAKTNATIVKTKESILRLQARLKTLRAKLAEAKKGIGRVPTKQSASKVLKLEAQIDATNEKLKRAKDRLKSAQRRLEIATVDAELAGDLLNQSSMENEKASSKNDSLVVAPKHRVAAVKNETSLPQIVEPVVEEDEIEGENKGDNDMAYEDKTVDTADEDFIKEENDEIETKEDNADDVKPLFNQDPKILNDEIAFKPIEFEAPVVPETSNTEIVPVVNQDLVVTEERTEETQKEEEITDETHEEDSVEKPVLESMKPIENIPEYVPPVQEVSQEEESLPVVEEEEKQESFIPTPVVQEERQQEPVFVPKTEELEEKTDVVMEAPVATIPPVAPVESVMPVAPYVANVDDISQRKNKPTLVYYLLLIILIVLAVFTLWLYQKSVVPAEPVLTPAIEQESSSAKTTFLKKREKSVKKSATEENIDDLPVFLDDGPAVNTSVKESVKEDVQADVQEEVPSLGQPEEDINEEDIEPQEPSAPEIMDVVPARVTGVVQEEQEQTKGLTEEDVLASKPVYEPGSKHDDMFVSGDDYVEVPDDAYADIEYTEDVDQGMPESGYEEQQIDQEYYPEDGADMEYTDENPFYDAEEEQYQMEQASLYYEE